MDVTYEVMKIGARLIPFPSNVKIITMQFTRLFIAVPMIFYVGLWSIKLAFLLFFRQLGVRSIRALNRWWWIITGITVVCFGLCYATLPYRCTLVSFKVTASAECQTQGLSFVSMGVNCALDVTTDIMSKYNHHPIRSLRHLLIVQVTSIPFIILHRIRISKQQKIALSAIFSLVVLTIIFAIVRATITTIGVKKQMDPTWVYMWTSIELNIGKSPEDISPMQC